MSYRVNKPRTATYTHAITIALSSAFFQTFIGQLVKLKSFYPINVSPHTRLYVDMVVVQSYIKSIYLSTDLKVYSKLE